MPLAHDWLNCCWTSSCVIGGIHWSVLSRVPWFAVKGSTDHPYALGSIRLDWESEDGETMNSRPMPPPAFKRNACVSLEFLLIMCLSLAYKSQVWSDPLRFLYSCAILLRWIFGCLGHKTHPNAQSLLRGADRGDVIVAICQCMNDADIEGRKALLGALQQSSSWACNQNFLFQK